MKSVASYRHILSSLGQVVTATILAQLKDDRLELPDYLSRSLLVQLIAGLGQLFPIFEPELFLEEATAFGGVTRDSLDEVVPISQLVCSQGFSPNDWAWEDLSDLYRFAICLLGDANDLGDSYRDDILGWWEQNEGLFDLPPLDEIGPGAVHDRLAHLPAPWNGLRALMDWLAAGTGSLFVDWSEEYLLEACWDWRWNAGTLNDLADDWAWARRNVFEPRNNLDDLCNQDPAALAICVDLALGRPVTFIAGLARLEVAA